MFEDKSYLRRTQIAHKKLNLNFKLVQKDLKIVVCYKLFSENIDSSETNCSTFDRIWVILPRITSMDL